MTRWCPIEGDHKQSHARCRADPGGSTQGVPHTSKPMDQLVKADGELPDWFREGMEAVMLAPTAMNQQKFLFSLQGDKVTAAAGRGFYTAMDLGIVRYHFEAVTGRTVG